MQGQTTLDSEVLAQVERVGEADIMVGIPSYKSAATVGHVVRAATAGLIQYFPDLKPVLVNSDGGSPDATRELARSTNPPEYVEKIILVRPAHRLQRVVLTYRGPSGKGSAFRAIFEIARLLKVKCCVVVDADLRSIFPEWIELLAGPIMKGGYDFVAPLYTRHKYDGTITNNLAYPLTRALYGKRIRQPIGGDFGLSSDLIEVYLESRLWDDYVAQFGIDIWMTTLALNEGFALCQAQLGVKVHDPKDPGSDLGPMFRQVVGTIFRLAGIYRENWLGVSGSRLVPEYGFERLGEPPNIGVNLERLVAQFNEGARAWAHLWERVISSKILGDVLALAKLPVESFYFPCELWVKVVYDFLAASLKASEPEADDLVSALSPLYFGRTASLVAETIDVSQEAAEQLLERQAREFERLKPYLVSKATR